MIANAPSKVVLVCAESPREERKRWRGERYSPLENSNVHERNHGCADDYLRLKTHGNMRSTEAIPAFLESLQIGRSESELFAKTF